MPALLSLYTFGALREFSGRDVLEIVVDDADAPAAAAGLMETASSLSVTVRDLWRCLEAWDTAVSAVLAHGGEPHYGGSTVSSSSSAPAAAAVRLRLVQPATAERAYVATMRPAWVQLLRTATVIVNHEYVGREFYAEEEGAELVVAHSSAPLRPERWVRCGGRDELALIPPISGG
jgi:hypothetical protein